MGHDVRPSLQRRRSVQHHHLGSTITPRQESMESCWRFSGEMGAIRRLTFRPGFGMWLSDCRFKKRFVLEAEWNPFLIYF